MDGAEEVGVADQAEHVEVEMTGEIVLARIAVIEGA